MAGFKKAKAEQAALKVGIYGAAGSGKTFTALLCAEGLAQLTKKRIAYVDTERGTDFYSTAVPERQVHPEAFDFDALYTRSLAEIIEAVKGLNPDEYSVIVIDSMTHVWEAAQAAYSGKQTSIGTIPFNAWGKIKKPYKELVAYLLSSPMHVFICGRQGTQFEEDEKTGELKNVGTKMKAEGETPYEPHILLHMEAVRQKNEPSTIVAFAEKDRTGLLAGKIIHNPGFDTLIQPILPLLGGVQAKIESGDESSAKDAEAFADQDGAKEKESTATLKRISAQLELAETKDAVKEIGKTITPALKKQMTTADVAVLRETYNARLTAAK